MTRFIVGRLGQSLVVVFGVIALTFIIMRVVPGDPAVTVAGPRASESQLAEVREQLGLNESLFVQFWKYLTGLVSGDLGESFRTGQAVASDLANAMPASLELTVFAIALALLFGLPLGVLAARFQGRVPDAIIRVLSVLSVSFPVFWLALILQNALATQMGWFPIAGEFDTSLVATTPLQPITNITMVDALIAGNWPVLGSAVAHVVLPAVVVAAYPTGLIAQMTRASLLDELKEPHTLMERALGYSPSSIIIRFSLRPAMTPIISVIALVFAFAIVNSFLVEAIFNWPGIGSYTYNAIRGLDTPAIAGVTLVVGIIYVLANLAVDIIQGVVDPRVRLAS